jgi:hypothetical protein
MGRKLIKLKSTLFAPYRSATANASEESSVGKVTPDLIGIGIQYPAPSEFYGDLLLSPQNFLPFVMRSGA